MTRIAPDTEQARSRPPNLDAMPTFELVGALAADHRDAVSAAEQAASEVAAAVDAAAPRLARGGRLVYAGAGTSGRLGLLDAVELGPTFSWPRERVSWVLAGGAPALTEAVEDAEDNEAVGAADVAGLGVGADDVLIVLAASGATPYALGAARRGRELGALTIGIGNNPGAALLSLADVPILLATGPELVAGSTRLKAGTAQKIALNTLSTALMVRLNKVFGHLMVDLRPTNRKLRLRATRMVATLAQVGDEVASQALVASDWEVKTAVLHLRAGLTPAESRRRLQACNGSLRAALLAAA